MSGEDEILLDEVLNGIEGIAEILRVLHRRHVVAHLAKCLCKGRATQTLLIVGEINMVEGGIGVVHQDRRHHFPDVGNFTAGGNDNRSGSDNLVAVGVLLTHGERVLTRRHIHVDSAAEIGQGFHGTIETGILAFL